jgi:hypothetical protein
MDFVGQLWLPILIATVICFMASAVIWMAGPHHKSEWTAAPDQDAIQDALRKANIQAGSYMVPGGDRGDKTAFETQMKKWAEGPSAVMFVFPRGPMNMGKMLVQQFVYFLVVNFMLAYIGHHGGLDGQPYLRVFQVIGSTALMAHLASSVPESIWFGRPWRNLAMQAVDALVYSLLTAGVFGWLWPR